jgi:hypothetical protein
MATLDANDIAVLIAKNGKWFDLKSKTAAQDIATAVAIALAESGGKTDAVSSTGDYGLFQINRAAHADLFASHNWKDPASNVDMARIVYQNAGNSFTPWVTYNNGAYQDHMKGAKLPVERANNARADLLGGIGNVSNVVGGALKDTMNFITQGFLTIGAALLAIILFSLGVWFVVSNTKTGQRVGTAAKETAIAAATKGLA